MADDHALWTIVGDLVETSRLHEKQIENLVTHVEQVTTHMPEAHHLSVIVSELAESENRWKTALAAPESKR